MSKLEILKKLIDSEIERSTPSFYNEYVRMFDKGYSKALFHVKELIEDLIKE